MWTTLNGATQVFSTRAFFLRIDSFVLVRWWIEINALKIVMNKK